LQAPQHALSPHGFFFAADAPDSGLGSSSSMQGNIMLDKLTQGGFSIGLELPQDTG
jgi:hypothetical protein